MFHVVRHIPVSAATRECFEEFPTDLAQTLTRIRGGADFLFYFLRCGGQRSRRLMSVKQPDSSNQLQQSFTHISDGDRAESYRSEVNFAVTSSCCPS